MFFYNMDRKMTKILGKMEFISELSLRTNFTKKDTKVFVDALQDLLSDCMKNQIPMNIRGLFDLDFTKLKERKLYDLHRKITRLSPESYRANISLSKNLKRDLRYHKEDE